MREIKFRAWEPTKKVMHYFDLNKAANDIYIAEHLFELMANTHSLGKDLLTQYSGLKDKNGVEIYEGDVIRTFEGDIVQVKWDDTDAAFCLVNDEIDNLMDSIGGCEVIGNIYENPEYND